MNKLSLHGILVMIDMFFALSEFLTTVTQFAWAMAGLGVAFVISSGLVVFIERFTYT